MVGMTGLGLMLQAEAQAHQGHKHHHGGHRHGRHHHGHGKHHNHQYKKAKAYNKGYRQGLKTGYYQTPYRYGYGYGPYAQPVVVSPGPWGAPPVQVGPPSVGFGFYF